MIIGSWALFALSAAIFWGLAYTMSGQVVRAGISTPFILGFVAVLTLPVYVTALIKTGSFRPSLDIVLNNKMLLLFLAVQAFSLLMGQYLIYAAISQKSVTYAAILEISYPIFVCLFTWILFKDLQMSWNIALGGLLIFSGSALVFLKSGS
jgi:drug/metabolite transporter (DMT)-like permease